MISEGEMRDMRINQMIRLERVVELFLTNGVKMPKELLKDVAMYRSEFDPNKSKWFKEELKELVDYHKEHQEFLDFCEREYQFYKKYYK